MADTRLEKLRRQLDEAEAALDIQQSIMAKKPDDPSRGLAALQFGSQGATFGFGDEIASGLSGIVEAAQTPGGFLNVPGMVERFGLRYDTEMARNKRLRNELREAFPKTATGSELAGGVGAGLGSYKVAGEFAKGLPTIPRILGIGGAEGALYGAGTADPGERTMGAASGGVTGMVATPLTLGIGSTIAVPLRGAAKRLGESLFGTPRDRAIKEIVKALDADQITIREADTIIRQMGRNATMADLGDATGRLGRVVTSQMGEGASSAKRFLDARQMMAHTELMQSARRATGASSFDRGVIDIINGAQSQAAPIYREIAAEVVDVTPILPMLNRPAMKAARRKATKLLTDEGYSPDIADDLTDIRYLDAIKRALGDQERAALKAGRGNEARVLGNLRREFVSELDAQVPRYADARSVFAGEAAMRDAADLGRTMFVGRKTSVGDAKELIEQMGDSELQSARLGFLEWLSDEVASQSMTGNTLVNKFANVPKFRQMVQLLFEDQQSVNEFLQKAGTLKKFGETRNLITGGSPTARLQGDRGGLSESVFDVALNSAIEPTSGIRSALSLIKDNTKLTPNVLKEIGEILMNPRVIPSQSLRRGPARLFEIPKMDPALAAMVSGGMAGSQSERTQPVIGDPLMRLLYPPQ